MKAWRVVGIWFLVMIGNAVCEDSAVVRASVSAVCPVRSAARSILRAGEKWYLVELTKDQALVIIWCTPALLLELKRRCFYDPSEDLDEDLDFRAIGDGFDCR
ncbi:unnamed protein product [Rhodiola kirilowii]